MLKWQLACSNRGQRLIIVGEGKQGSLKSRVARDIGKLAVFFRLSKMFNNPIFRAVHAESCTDDWAAALHKAGWSVCRALSYTRFKACKHVASRMKRTSECQRCDRTGRVCEARPTLGLKRTKRRIDDRLWEIGSSRRKGRAFDGNETVSLHVADRLLSFTRECCRRNLSCPGCFYRMAQGGGR